jgi:hypothetical protein
MFRWPYILANDQTDAQIFNTFITILYMYMFRAISCSSSGGQIVLIQHLASSLSVSDLPVHRTVTYWERRYQMAPDGHLLRVTIPDGTERSLTESDDTRWHRTVTYWEWRYQMLYEYNLTSWGWARYCSKHEHVESCNKCTKICASKLVIG